MDSTFRVFDFHRIFIGDAPITYLLEIVFRTAIMYLYTIFLLRILGKRGMGQLSALELAIIISFGSAVGDPMISADIPIFHGMTAITIVALLQVKIERLINKNKKVEAVLEGTANLVVEEGVIKWQCMKEDNISKEDLFRSLRQAEVEHLGQVRKAYFETTGQISVQFQPPRKVRPGLSVAPETETAAQSLIAENENFPAADNYACLNCGHTRQFAVDAAAQPCSVCQKTEWTKAESANNR